MILRTILGFLLVLAMITILACHTSDTTYFEEIKRNTFNGTYFAARKNGKWGFIDSDQQVKINFEFDEVGEFKYGVARANKDEKYGYIDNTGRTVIPLVYENVASHYDSLAWVSTNFKMGFINIKTGKQITPVKYDETTHFGENDYTVVMLGKKKGLINRNGEEVVHPGLSEPDEIGSGYFSIKDKKGWRIISEYPTVDTFAGYYDHVGLMDKNSGLIPVCKNSCGFINIKEQPVIPFSYGSCNYFNEGLCIASKDGKEGFINIMNQVAIPFMYDPAFDFHEGYAIVKKNGLYGVIDTLNYTVIPFIYNDISYVNLGKRYVARLQNGKGSDNFTNIIFNKSQKELELTGRIFLINDSEGNLYYVVKRGNLYGVIDRTGKHTIPAIWPEIHNRKNSHFYDRVAEGDYIRVKNDQGVGVANIKTGQMVIDPEFDDIKASGRPGLYIGIKDKRYQLVKVRGYREIK